MSILTKVNGIPKILFSKTSENNKLIEACFLVKPQFCSRKRWEAKDTEALKDIDAKLRNHCSENCGSRFRHHIQKFKVHTPPAMGTE